ncbi:alkaline phosphatase D family protein [Anthocerotibacter panamensis]|uniref:alkaline phosphatase D family protein n=1 Tax=Anthocerotibacter panamensis TaxID=2857077 RepID=UPI001C406C26|nr:alkaline phosphatase D family protein [Anthocerotibacter panamensis]
MKRREAGISILGFSFLATAPARANTPLPATLPNGVAAGDVTQTSAVLWTRSTIAGNVTFEYGTDPSFTVAQRLTKRNTIPSKPFKLPVQGLTPDNTYFYRVTNTAGDQATGTFRTPAASGFQGMRFGISGDWRGELSPYPAIRNVPGRDLDFFVEFGDTIYADFPSPAVPLAQTSTISQFRAKHNEVYSARFGLNTWADLRATTAIFSVIDDHEVTDNFAGGAPPASDTRFAGQAGNFINETTLYNNGLQVFQEFNPIRNEYYGETGDPRTANKRKLYRFRTFGQDAAMFLLDTRSFRDQELTPITNPLDPAQIGAFLTAAFNPARTILGAQQLSDLQNDLQAAQQAGITWKFVLVPEPIQNLGILGAEDRFEGYAAERTALLSFIATNNITNVVFVTADIHGTVINDVSYQTAPFGPSIPTGAFEISTGSVAFDAPFGPTVAFLAFVLQFPGALSPTVYAALPPASQEAYITGLINGGLTGLGYPAIGLDGFAPATLVSGGYTATNSYGWTEFDIDQATQVLTVTTYGIPFYTQAQIENPTTQAEVLSRVPAILSQFTVQPV